MKKLALMALAAILISLTAPAQLSPDRKMRMVQGLIDTYYVDTVNSDKIAEAAIVAMLGTLDPHSVYSNAEETKALTEPLQGNFSGIGIQFNMLQDSLYVIQTIAGGPSEQVGVRAGDRIIAANDTAISGVKMSNADIIKRLRGPKGSVVNIEVCAAANSRRSTSASCATTYRCTASTPPTWRHPPPATYAYRASLPTPPRSSQRHSTPCASKGCAT